MLKRIIKIPLLLIFSSYFLSACLPVAFVGAGSSAMMFAKDRSAKDALYDLKIASSIKSAFITEGFKEIYTKINVEVFAGRVLLTGRLENTFSHDKVLGLVKSQNGVKEVLDEITVTNEKIIFDAPQYARDSLITSQIKSQIFKNRDIKSINFIVVTNYDVVYLFGIARSSDELDKVANIAANINGVKKVVSHILLSDNNISSNSSNNTDEHEADEHEDEIYVKDINSELSKY